MKSFRLYPTRPTKPAREVADYSMNEQSRLFENFRSISAKYRIHERIGYIGIAGLLLSILSGFLLSKVYLPLLTFPVILFALLALGSALTAPPLVCPGCGNLVDRKPGKYCPSCGSSELEAASWFRPRRCVTCGSLVALGGKRRSTIRACTHCGLTLDKKGL